MRGDSSETGVPREEYEAISRLIHSDESPVGIDAKRTHILILYKLGKLEERLELLEARLASVPEDR